MSTNSDFLKASAISLAHAQDARKRRRRNRRVLGLLLLLLLLIPSIGTSYLTLALFTDQETVDADFTAGTIALDAGKIDALVLTIANLMPSDQITDDVVVENDGNATLRYSVSTSSTGAGPTYLRDVLVLTIKTVDATTPLVPCDNFDGTQLFTGVLGSGGAVVGNPAPGADGGERTLAGGANETLCFRVALPGTTGNAYQGLTTTTTFTFDAEQTTGN